MRPEMFQTVYECENLDFNATYEGLKRFPKSGAHRIPVGRKPQPDSGPLTFKLYPFDVGMRIYPNHRAQIVWKDDKEKKACLPELLKRLVPWDKGKPVVLKPLHTTIIKVPYPGPPNFILAWCDEENEYFRAKTVGLEYSKPFMLCGVPVDPKVFPPRIIKRRLQRY